MQHDRAAGMSHIPLDQSSIVRRIGRNAGVVLTGNIVIAGLGFVTLALNTRALGATGFGTLVLIMSIGGLLAALFALQSWVALVKLGSGAIASGDHRRLREIIATAYLFDFVSALTAAVVGVAVVFTAAETIGIDAAYAPAAAVFMASVATRIVDAPTGVLRLFNRFEIVIAAQIAGAVLSCLLAAGLYFASASLSAYVLGFAGVSVITNLLMIGAGLRIARLNGASPAWPRRDTVVDFWNFSWPTGISGVIYTAREQGVVLLVGAMLGPAAAGIYHVAARIAGTLGLIDNPLSQAIFPEAARLAAASRHEALRQLVVGLAIVGGAMGIASVAALMWIGTDVIQMVGGPGYSDAHWPLVVMTVAYGLLMTGVGVRNAVLTTIGPKAMLLAGTMSLSAVAAAPIAIHAFGLIGAALSYSAYDALRLIILVVIYARWLHSKKG